jgi:Ni,Fe-hydrogenase III component G
MNMAEDFAKKIQEKFPGKIDNVFVKSPRRIYVDIKAFDLPEIAGYVFNELKGRFMIMTGVDTHDAIEVLTHFGLDEAGIVLSLRTFASKPACEQPSLTPMIKGAEYIEREIHELLGVNFIGHPNQKHLLLPDDWPDGKYPLRRNNV